MRLLPYPIAFSFFLVCSMEIYAQNSTTKLQNRISVFVDCTSTWCDETYIRSEITIVDFLLDRQSADVHVLYTRQPMGNGGQKHQLIFYGQKSFAGKFDTLSFEMLPLATDVEIREKLLHYLKAGLIPYIVKTSLAGYLQMELNSDHPDGEKLDDTTDKWDYWVFRVGSNGNMNADQNYFNTDVDMDVSANRTTDQLKVSFILSSGRDRAVFKITDEDGTSTDVKVINTRYRLNHTLVKSINDHWSYGYYFFIRNNTFSNIRLAPRLIPAVEYNLFRYKDVNTRYLAISYGFETLHNRYYEETIYNKTSETLTGQVVRLVGNFNQKWETLSGNITYNNYLHNWNLFSLEANMYADVRVTGNLSFWVAVFGGLTRNQVFIPKLDASVEDVLTRRRQLASNYNLGMWFGLNYRFGSMLNNFVNPRFTDEF